MNKIFLFVALWVLAGFASFSFAQTTDMGTPRSWRAKQTLPSPHTETMPRFDLQAALQIDAINEANKVGAWRFGYEHHVQYGLTNAGTWTSFPNGDRIWRMGFRSPDALSMNLVFSQYQLPQGATVYLFNPTTKEYLGAYTHQNNSADRMLGTMLLAGEEVVVEYYEPAAVSGQGSLEVGTVVHGYKSISLYAKQLKALNDAGKCNYDVKCPLGVGWEDQINAVAMIVDGGGLCSGALVNNTANDGTPYFLTANHCTGGGVGGWSFWFNWESPVAVCATNAASQMPPLPNNVVNGCVLRANSAGSDFALLQLNSTPTGAVYYAGWSRSTTPATEVTGIHHPSGDVKKISRENDPVTAGTWSGAQTWDVAQWDLGVTEGGSSGSPLFDQNQRIIGQLYGGGSACSGTSPNGQGDSYGRFGVSWVGGGTNSTRLSNWLDPVGSAPQFIDGYDPNASPYALDAGVRGVAGFAGSPFCNQTSFNPVVTLRNFGTSPLTSATIFYGINGGAASAYSWTGTLATSATTTVALPSVTAVGGTNIFFAYSDSLNGAVDSNHVNDTIRQSFDVIVNGQSVPFTIVTDCYAEETSWRVFSGATTYASGGGYSNGAAGTHINNILCLPLGCYTLRVYDSYGDGLNGNYPPQCSLSGDFYLLGLAGDTLVNLNVPNSDFGDSTSFNFCITAPVAPVAAFNSNNTTACVGTSILFNDQSTGATARTWTFQGGTPASSTATSPSVTYSAAGTYSVTLVVSNTAGADTMVQTNLITVVSSSVSVTGTPTPTNSNTGSVSTSVSGGTAPYTYHWSNNKTTANITGLTAGSYSVTVTDANGCTNVQSFSVLTVDVSHIQALESFNLFPNPAQEQATLSLSLSQAKDIQVVLVNALGQQISVVQYPNVQTVQHLFDMRELSSGMYFVQISIGNEQIARKLVKQ